MRLCVIGGFLGAGKTTFIAAVARALLRQGKRVGIVTNDQGDQLVDSAFLASEELSVLEVTGGCFCCNFDEFVGKLATLAANPEGAPDVILAEPVGSCTDLVATIFKPMSAENAALFEIAPFTVVADPKRARKFLAGGDSLFPDEINYLFGKQLEEADLLLLNKVDGLSEEERDALARGLSERFPGARVLPVSAKEGWGVQPWLGHAMGEVFEEKASLDIAYDRYGKAEQYLGWLNGSFRMEAKTPVGVGAWIEAYLEALRARLRDVGEIAHVKAYAVWDAGHCKASLVSLEDAVQCSGDAHDAVKAFRLVVNARVLAEPEALRRAVMEALEAVCDQTRVGHSGDVVSAFAPGWPRPSRRMA